MQSNTANYGLSGKLTIVKPSNAIKKLIFGSFSFLDSAGSALRRSEPVINYSTDSNAWTGLKIFYNSGNIASGTVYVYGIKKS
jgi:hypothetical protein